MNWNLKTDRFLVRFASEADIPALYTLLSEESVVRHLPRHAMVVEAQAMDEARRMVMQFEAREAVYWLIEDRVTGEIFGRLAFRSFNWIHGHAEMQLELREDKYSPETVAEILYPAMCLAFEDLSLHRIEWQLMAEHPWLPEILDNLGFQHEGRIPSALEFESRWIDMQVYSMLNTDEPWQSAVEHDGFSRQ